MRLKHHPAPSLALAFLVLNAVGVVAHGEPGAVHLGSAELDGRSLVGHAADLEAVGAALRPGGELDLCSCGVAAGPAGEAFLRDLAGATGAGVAASARPVESAALGGRLGAGRDGG